MVYLKSSMAIINLLQNHQLAVEITVVITTITSLKFTTHLAFATYPSTFHHYHQTIKVIITYFLLKICFIVTFTTFVGFVTYPYFGPFSYFIGFDSYCFKV